MLPPTRGTTRPHRPLVPRPGPGPVASGPIASQRATVDYALSRRAVLQELRTGRTTTTDVCDAHPHLVRAARHHGAPTGQTCPVCRRVELAHLAYAYGDELGASTGRLRSRPELEAMAREHGEFRVYVVEVCTGCEWNHLVTSYVLGDGVPRPVPARRRGGGAAALDDELP